MKNNRWWNERANSAEEGVDVPGSNCIQNPFFVIGVRASEMDCSIAVLNYLTVLGDRTCISVRYAQ